MKLSEKRLEALAKFLGRQGRIKCEKYTDDGYIDSFLCCEKFSSFTSFHREMFANWLLSPEGQAALMDKIEMHGTCAIDFSRSASGMKKEQTKSGEYVLWVHFCTISLSNKDGIMDYDSDRKETRQEALIAAALDMLGVTE